MEISVLVAVATLSQQTHQCGEKWDKYMERREATLFKSKILLAAVYYDPHYRMMLTDNQQLSAKDACCNLPLKIH